MVAVLVAILVISLFFSGILPSPFKPGDELKYPEKAWISGLTDPRGNLILNGQTTTEKVMTIKGKVVNPSVTSTGTSMPPGNAAASKTLLLVGTARMGILPVQTGVFNGRVSLLFNGQERFLEVSDIPDEQQAVDLWEFEGNLVLARGENTFQIFVQDVGGNVVGQSKPMRANANIAAMSIRVNLTWDTNSSDVDLHVWHFPWIVPYGQPGASGGMDGAGNWWLWGGKWMGTEWQSEWYDYFTHPLPNYSRVDWLEAYTWRNYSYDYGGLSYNYMDGVGHCYWPGANYTVSGIAGGSLDIDDTNGLGPEVFTMETARPGLYTVVVRMYNPHACTKTTNAKVYIELFEKPVGTFSHAFEPITHLDSVIRVTGVGGKEEDFPNCQVADWVAYYFCILPDNTVSAAEETQYTEFNPYADIRVSAGTGTKNRDVWFLIDHNVTIRQSEWPEWMRSLDGQLDLERIYVTYEIVRDPYFVRFVSWEVKTEFIMRIWLDAPAWYGTNIDIPPGLYRLTAGNSIEGYNEIKLDIKFLTAG